MDKKQIGVSFRFRRNDTIGNAEAESDDNFLRECFVDTGELDILRDLNNSKRIIVGRTGAGKSALVKILSERSEHVIELKPENLSLNYLSNSAVLRFFEDAGASLDVFYQLLWKHVIAVELIQKRYKITNEQTQKSFLEKFSSVFSRDKTKERAIEYLRAWGSCFWNETETRVREVASKIESELKASLSGSAAALKFNTGGTEKLTVDEKLEVVQRGSHVVDQLQLSALNNVLKLLAEEVFIDSQSGYFVVIDDLDTKWAEDNLKFKLIRALIETVKSFRQVHHVKIVVALRLDLLQRVVAATKDSGFQSEKYESMYLRLRWEKAQLIEIVTRRLSKLVHSRYTTQIIPLTDLFPKFIYNKHESFFDYLCNRTSLRPRDAILFINECLTRSGDRSQITTAIVKDAEAAYSEKRLLSLTEEWSSVYPLVAEYSKVLTHKPQTFSANEFMHNTLDPWIYGSFLGEVECNDPVEMAARSYVEGKTPYTDVVLELLDALYTIGMIGIRAESGGQMHWSYFSEHKPARASLKGTSIIDIHPTFWRTLGVRIK